ncbi:ABC transporter ATP-binding protein [candidate division KSB1 bacterium]|nr:ABC transporter ATP-binding protein [candidate division KSB1 bacterium]RQW01295.1 MAG: ABC transporter ATP-binding protein [candidate division KSB1 bacterium]
MTEPIIKIRDLHTSYGKRHILKGINLDIYPYETLVILGRSGCGKSTLLRHIIGLNSPDKGEIFIKGVDITKASERQRDVILRRMGMLFQSGALFNSMTVGENVALPLMEHTPQNKSIIKIMMRMKLNLVGLSGFEDFMPSQLSGGMKKRAALARALSMDPDILFCDEPSAGLDPIVAVGIDHLILKLKTALRMTIVVVTHEMASVFTIADRICLLHDGEIKFLGTQDNIKESTDPFVVQFLERRPDEEKLDAQNYLDELVAD